MRLKAATSSKVVQQKSNPSKRHRERLNSELDHLASLLPFEQSIITKLDKLSILRLAVCYLRTKSYFQAAIQEKYNQENNLLQRLHHHIHHHNNSSNNQHHQHHHVTYTELGLTDSDCILQALNGFLTVVTCNGEVFFTSHTVEQYLGFHQSDIIHQSVFELIHSEDRDHFKAQLNWRYALPHDLADITLQEILQPEHSHLLQRCFTVRFRCLLDNTSGFIMLEISGRIQVVHGQSFKSKPSSAENSEEVPLALFGLCSSFGPLPHQDVTSQDYTFKSKHRMDMSPLSMDPRYNDRYDDNLGPKDTANSHLGQQSLMADDVAIKIDFSKTGSKCITISTSAPQRLIPHFMGGHSPDVPTVDGGSFGTCRGFETQLNSLGNHQSCLMPGMKLTQHHIGSTGGKMFFGFTDHELQEKGGYDLVHTDDLGYYASAHYELIKTGSSGLIAYRLMTKDSRWIWLQTSSKVVYKNSKPDFIVCTHRYLVDDEGRDLARKRGTEFKFPYSFTNHHSTYMMSSSSSSITDDSTEYKSAARSHRASKRSKSQLREYLQASRKRKAPYRELQINPNHPLTATAYTPFPSPVPPSAVQSYLYGGGQADLMGSYPSRGYSAFDPEQLRLGYQMVNGSFQPSADSYFYDVEKNSALTSSYNNHYGYYRYGYGGYYTGGFPYSGYTDIMETSSRFKYHFSKGEGEAKLAPPYNSEMAANFEKTSECSVDLLGGNGKYNSSQDFDAEAMRQSGVTYTNLTNRNPLERDFGSLYSAQLGYGLDLSTRAGYHYPDTWMRYNDNNLNYNIKNSSDSVIARGCEVGNLFTDSSVIYSNYQENEKIVENQRQSSMRTSLMERSSNTSPESSSDGVISPERNYTSGNNSVSPSSIPELRSSEDMNGQGFESRSSGNSTSHINMNSVIQIKSNEQCLYNERFLDNTISNRAESSHEITNISTNEQAASIVQTNYNPSNRCNVICRMPSQSNITQDAVLPYNNSVISSPISQYETRNEKNISPVDDTTSADTSLYGCDPWRNAKSSSMQSIKQIGLATSVIQSCYAR